MKRQNKVGDTPLIEASSIASQYKIKGAFIKDESKNTSGTIKDRRNVYIVQEANRLKVDKLVLITSGSNGYSLAQFAKPAGIKVVCIISRDLAPEIKHLLKQNAYQVIELNLEHKILRPEEIIAFAREKEDEVIWEVTNSYEENYGAIVKEVLRKTSPSHIVVPLGSGGIFLGIAQAIERYSPTTRVIGIGVQNTIRSFADKLSTPWTPYAKALDHYQKLGHPIYRLTEEEVKKTYQLFKNLVDCEPSSAVVFAALEKHKFGPDDTVVFINSGKTPFTI